MAVFFSHSPEETFLWAKNFARTLSPGDVLLLEGDMGAGKTVLAQGVASGLGISATVTSPTYTYVNCYEDRLFHFDCYRISSERQALELGLADYFEMNAICLVEWGQNIQTILPKNCKHVRISGHDDEREIEF